MRTAGRHDTEVRVAALTRPAQAVFLLALAVAGASLSTLVAVVAFVDLLAAAAITRSIGSNWEATWREMAVLPSRALGAHMVVQLLALAYLRADAVLVGRLLGQGAGATYNLIYRVVDGLLGLATPGLLLFFPFAARRLTRGQRVDSVRRHAWSLVPVFGASLALAAQWSAGGVAHFIPRFSEGLSALRILVVSVPLYYVAAAELYLRAAEGRNREVLLAGISTLALNVVLNIALIPRNGLEGAAWALVVTEAAQLTVLSYSNFGSSNLRFSVAPLGMTAALAINALLLDGRVVAGSTIVSLLLALSLIQLLRRGVGSLATSVMSSASRFPSKGVPRQPIDQGWLSGSTS